MKRWTKDVAEYLRNNGSEKMEKAMQRKGTASSEWIKNVEETLTGL